MSDISLLLFLIIWYTCKDTLSVESAENTQQIKIYIFTNLIKFHICWPDINIIYNEELIAAQVLAD